MGSRETRREARAKVVRQLGGMLRRQAQGRWDGVRTARRREQGFQAWRFSPGAGAGERYLRVSFEAMERARHSSRALYKQLTEGDWLDRLDGGEPALGLAANGRVEPYSAAN
jgi:hypothetical protein